MPLRLKSSLETFQTEKNPTTRMNAHTRSQVVSAVQACEEKKGEEISILEMDKNSSAFTDYFVICSGKNPRQIQAIADEVELRLKREGVRANQVEGYNHADWVLIDYVDFVVHVFSEGARKFQVSGVVRIRAIFAATGEVTNIVVVKGLPHGLTTFDDSSSSPQTGFNAIAPTAQALMVARGETTTNHNKPAVGTQQWHQQRKDNHKEGKAHTTPVTATGLNG